MEIDSQTINKDLEDSILELIKTEKLTPDERTVYDLKMFHKENLKNADLFQFQEGKEEGIEEGKMKKNLENAKQMKLKDISPEIIAEITNLTLAQIEAL